MAFIAGHYAAIWNTVNIGTTREGFRLLETHHAEMIVTDDFGDVPVDGIVRGTESRLQLDYVEYDLVTDAIYAQPNAGAIGAGDLIANKNVGLLLTGLSKVLVLTAVASTPADQKPEGIKTLTADQAIVVSDVDTLMASRLRQGPLTFQLLPKIATPFDTYTLTQGT